MIEKTISHYKILEKIGSGGMGTVYKAKDTKLDRLVALKFLPPHLSQAEDEKKRFIHEAYIPAGMQRRKTMHWQMTHVRISLLCALNVAAK